MLQQVLIIKDEKIIYQRKFSKAISKEEFQILFMKLKKETSSDFSRNSGNYVSFENRLTYKFERDLGLFFIFLSGLVDEIKDLEDELEKLKDEFLDLFGEVLEKTIDSSLLEVLNPIVDSIHSNLRPKISLVGFSGVGKTTTTKLIKEEEIPIEHVPTITGARAIIKIGKLQFVLWDFAGQEQFSYLWNNFVKGSDACLIITDSTLENVEKSKFFIELIKEEAPYANTAVIANKQDLSGALKTEEVERIVGLKTYAMIAIDPKNRAKMIRIISDVLEISTDVSPLLKPIYDRDLLILDAQRALERGEYANALSFFEKVSDLCLEIGDDSLGKQFYEKAENLRKKLSEKPPLPAQAPEIVEQPKPSEITEPESSPPEAPEITEPEPSPPEAPEITEPEPPEITEPEPLPPEAPEIFEPEPLEIAEPEPPEIIEPEPPEIFEPEPPEITEPEPPEIIEPEPPEITEPEPLPPEAPEIIEPEPLEIAEPEPSPPEAPTTLEQIDASETSESLQTPDEEGKQKIREIEKALKKARKIEKALKKEKKRGKH